MGLLDGSAGLLFKIEADASQFERETRAVDASVGTLGNRMSSLAGIASIAGAGILALALAAVTGSVALFNLAKAASEYGSEIFDATEKTGLAAETISSLKVAADQSGTSLESVTSGLAKFAKTIGEANDGLDKAQDKLKKIGVTSLDLDTALSQALSTIAKYPPGIQQMTAAQAAFGKSGADLLPFIKSFDGDLPALIAKCKELGLTMTDSNARAADEFGDTLDTLKAQAAATGRTFAFEFMPDITRAMSSVSKAFSENKEVIRGWAEAFGNFLRGVISGFKEIIQFYNDHPILSRVLLGIATFGASEVVGGAVSNISAVGQRDGLRGDLGGRFGGGAGSINSNVADATKGKGNSDAERAAREAEALARRELQAQISMAQNLLSEFQKKFADAIAKTIAEMPTDKLYSDADVLALQSGFGEYLERIQRAQAALFRLQNQQRENMTTAERDLLSQQQRLEKEKLRIDTLAQFGKLTDSISDAEKKNLDAISERLELEIRQKKELLEIEEKRRVDLPSVPLADPTDATPAPVSNPFKDTMAWLTDPGQNGAVMQTMEQFAQGLGNIINQLVLMGTAGPNAMRKVTASVLASVAAQAAVQAIMFTAYGIAALTPWGAGIYGPAAPWFKAALVMASVAAVSGGLGRTAAGNAFSGDSGSGSGSLSGSDTNNGNRPGLRFTETFNGFQDSIKSGIETAMKPVREVVGAMREEIGKFRETFGVASPGDVVMAGAGAASGAIFDAHLSALRDDGGRSTDMKREMGDFQ